MTRKLKSETSSQKIDVSADIIFGFLALQSDFVILDLKDQETPIFPCLVIWRRLDNVQIKQTSNHTRNAVKFCVKTRYLNGKIHNGSE